MQAPAGQLSKDMLVVCFSRVLPWNDPRALHAALSFDSESLCIDDTVPDYDKNAVSAQLRGMKSLAHLAMVSRLFSEAAHCVRRNFKDAFLRCIGTHDCTIEGVHAAVIVFQRCSETVELLCEKMQYAGVSDHWPTRSWYDDFDTQMEFLESEAVHIMAENNPDREYTVLTEDIFLELAKRLLVALKFHPRSQKIFARCVSLFKMFKDSPEWRFDEKIVNLLEVNLHIAMKPNFKRLYPNLWTLNTLGIDVDRACMRNTVAQHIAYKKLGKYVQVLCETWNLLTSIQNREITLQMNQEQLEENFLQINWFSVSDYAILLLHLRQMVCKN